MAALSPRLSGPIALIANPAAQNGRGAWTAVEAASRLSARVGDQGFYLLLTERPGHATELAAELPPETAAAIALGGDGLVNEVACGLMKRGRADRPPLAVIPAGSGNDYAATLGMAASLPRAIDQILEFRTGPADIGQVNDRYFVETLSFGLDAAIALDTIERRKRTGKQGKALYLASGIDQLLHHRDTFHATAVLDGGRRIEGPVHQFAVQLGPTYGGGFLICPEADPTDGFFDICYADAPMNLLEATYKFMRAKEGRHTRFKDLHFERAETIDISFDRRPPCQIDGEPLVADSYRITMEPRALEVLCAASPLI